MTSGKRKSTNIKTYKNKKELNLGLLLFAVVFIYLVVTVVMYLTGENISVYEVRKGSIVKDNSYTGLIIRQESAVMTEAAGYINYYQNENTKVKAGTYIYALSPEKLDTSKASEEDTAAAAELNPEIQAGIIFQIQNFNENYHPEDFSAVYPLKNEISASLQEAFSSRCTDHLSTLISESGFDVTSYATPQDGVVAFTVDGYESLTKDTFTKENFDRSVYESTVLSDQMKAEQGSPAYRLITSENWSVIVPLDKETAEDLKKEEVTSIRVRIDKDSETLWADFSVLSKDGDYYGCLDFDNSMIRYAEDRYLNVELILEDESGLKIPKSSVVEEKFFVIPEDYITNGGNSSSDGVMVKNKNGEVEFHAIDIYGSAEDGEVCVSRDDIKEGTVLVKPEASETYTIGKTKSLQGVYNINKGYAVFKRVTILCENDEYYIVREGDSYGLYNYDHIVQNGSSVSSEEVVFQ